jgi:hypothetical protein
VEAFRLPSPRGLRKFQRLFSEFTISLAWRGKNVQIWFPDLWSRKSGRRCRREGGSWASVLSFSVDGEGAKNIVV